MAARFESKALAASAALAQGRVRLAAGDAADAERHFEVAAHLWHEVGAPYETALARMGLGDALRAAAAARRLDPSGRRLRAIGATLTAPSAQASARRRTRPMPFVARATTGRWRSRGARFA